ncbi:MAG TPA: hypothetical protein VIY48_08145 [Candidatus Paceibacterota bacterium]
MTPFIDFTELESIRDLPPHIPGKVSDISLDDLPVYLAMHGLAPVSMSAEGVLIVKREGATP